MGDYPGAGRHHQYGGGGGGNYGPPVTYGGASGGYGAPPPGPPPGWGGAPQYAPPSHGPGYGAPPPGPPPGHYGGGGGYGGPPGGYDQGGYAPPAPQHYQRQDLAYNGAPSYDRRSQGSGNGWQPPTGQGMPNEYQTGSSGYDPTQMHHNHQQSGPTPYRPPSEAQFYGPQFHQNQGADRQPFFQYSQCSGKKKALCIGINYIGTSQALSGCINDARNMMKFLCDRFGYQRDDIVLLTDDAQNPRQVPTGQNIRAAMNWLISGAQPNDSLFFHYSGHGGQTQDLDGDEDDGNDEVIYPVDHKINGHMVDDELHEIMVRPLPAGCRLTAIFDSCHSASALDLPYIYSTQGTIKEPNLLAEAGQGLMAAGVSYLKGDVGGMLSGVMGLGKKIINQNSGAADKAKKSKTSAADVISWSGCKDDQTSADTQIASQATGAMSYAFIASLSSNPQQSYMQLLNSIRDELRNKYSQKPQLSASHPMDCNLLFIA